MVISITSYIWDTGALSLFFANHDKAMEKMKEVKSGSANGLVPSLILSEFYYKTWQKFGKQTAQVRVISLREVLEEIPKVEKDDIFEIGELKVKNSTLSLADCVLITFAKKNRSMILTTEEPITTIENVKSKKLKY